ncbi:hypothetical protein CKALI_03190 [Corynebacterium kalinowskii]|uniref:Uncharacterized protein n=1 Tax=Corynebacterium kalinowskii TaxID=2675216 RepID=A0A6B8VP01_9CORY|nr:hypothetical protein [Corynebacterium kalinowskii]QGU01521.1 hypothetical protein CKALI_03190 [Corynebacterium kalinowskii]
MASNLPNQWLQQATQALRMWGPREWATTVLASVGTAVLIGLPTVLIPNSWFHRDVPPTWWSYPVWILTAIASGMLVATYLKAPETQTKEDSSTLGFLGTFLTWFAVGCPVCNKIALVLLGYSGALTYFAPVQPLLGIGALLLLSIALIARLKGQIACPVKV